MAFLQVIPIGFLNSWALSSMRHGGKRAFWFWLSGFFLAFLPLYLLGFMGMTRRLNHYGVQEWNPLLHIAAVGSFLIAIGVVFQVKQVLVSIKDKEKNRDLTGDPWNGRTLEWSTISPPPYYNFATLPEVQARDPFWEMKKEKAHEKPLYKPFHMPKNTAIGLYIGVLTFFVGFGLVWYMWWMAITSSLGILALVIVKLYQKEPEFNMTIPEIEKVEGK